MVARRGSAIQPERESVLPELARIADAATADKVLVPDVLLAPLDPARLRFVAGAPKRLRADGAPRDLRVVSISGAE